MHPLYYAIMLTMYLANVALLETFFFKGRIVSIKESENSSLLGTVAQIAAHCLMSRTTRSKLFEQLTVKPRHATLITPSLERFTLLGKLLTGFWSVAVRV